MDYDTGRRVAFGRDGAPEASLAEAVMASCSIPGWYARSSIGGRRYVDGGTLLATSRRPAGGRGPRRGLRARADGVLRLRPAPSRPARVERAFRRTVTRRMLGEAAKVRRAGTAVTMLGPGREDLEAIGANLMDPVAPGGGAGDVGAHERRGAAPAPVTTR